MALFGQLVGGGHRGLGDNRALGVARIRCAVDEGHVPRPIGAVILATDKDAVRKRRLRSNWSSFRKGPQWIPGLVLLIESIFGIHGKSILRCDGGYEYQPQRGRLAHHPAQREIGERGAVGIGRITAVNVAMYAAEPNLLPCLPGQRWNRRSPKRGGKFGAPFVDGHGVIGIQDIRMQSRIQEAVNERTDTSEDGGNAERSYGVPNADHGQLRVEQIAALVELSQQCCSLVFIAIRLKSCFDHSIGEIRRGKTADGDHSRQAAGGICTAAEAKKKDFVALFIGVCNLSVAILDFLKKPRSESATS